MIEEGIKLDLNDPELQEIMAQCYLSTRAFSKALFPSLFNAPFSSLHDEIFKLIDSGHKRIAIAAPRGIGKTTIAKTIATKGILFRDMEFIVYVSNSATSAEMQTESIKRELLTNEIVKELFGSIKVNKYKGIDETFSKTAWVAFGSTFVLPRGSGQQVRGLNWNGKRPQLVIIDDLENKKEVKNENIRADLNEWFFSDLMKTEDKYGGNATFIYIDTIKHEDCLLQKLLESDDWASIKLSICDDQYNTNDENYMTTEEIKAEVEEHRKNGDMDIFYMERMNEPISTEDAVFKQEYFKYFTEHGSFLRVYEMDKTEEVRTKDLMSVVIVDPAKTVKLHSAESAVVCISVCRRTHRIFVRDIIAKKFYPDELYDAMFELVLMYRARVLAVEVTSLHEFISQPIKSEMKVRGIHPHYIELNAQGKKEERIAMLAPNYRLGYMYHNKSNCGPLEKQLRGFPRSKLWDVMDATAYIIKLMDKLSYYFDSSDDEEEPMNTESEYDELDYDDDKPLDDWRIGV